MFQANYSQLTNDCRLFVHYHASFTCEVECINLNCDVL